MKKKRFLKIINQLNEDVPIVKYTLNEEDNYIYIDAQTSLDPNPDIDDLIPELMKLLMAAKGYFVDKMNK